MKYIPNFCFCKVINDMAAEYIVYMLPDLKAFGQECKYINDPSLMPDLKWQNIPVGNSQTLDQNVKVTKHKHGLQPQRK